MSKSVEDLSNYQMQLTSKDSELNKLNAELTELRKENNVRIAIVHYKTIHE